jgi:hypothetical protein
LTFKIYCAIFYLIFENDFHLLMIIIFGWFVYISVMIQIDVKGDFSFEQHGAFSEGRPGDVPPSAVFSVGGGDCHRQVALLQARGSRG